MILADDGIPWLAIANDLPGLASQEPLLAAFYYTDLRMARLPRAYARKSSSICKNRSFKNGDMHNETEDHSLWVRLAA
jgi:hypothetical protein